ncbi:MAG: hypothetical protein JW726_03785 [Anaerolineales bacterium]|nr:hypothetical protein [Anaerolineales bacterium]
MNANQAHPNPALSEAKLISTLIQVLDHAQPILPQVEYRLVGTASALLYGVQLPAADIDILVKDRQEVDLFAQALKVFPCSMPPTLLEEQHQYIAGFLVDGVEVEISTVEVKTTSDAVETFGAGPWKHFEHLPCGPYMVPAVSLELRLVTELGRQREDRYCPILEFLRCYGCDAELVCHAMEAWEMEDTLQRNVLSMLSGEF